MDILSAREKAFVDEYVVSGNASASAVTAGYSRAAARQTGHKILKRRRVQEELARRAPAMSATREVEAGARPVFSQVFRIDTLNGAGGSPPPPLDGELLAPVSGDCGRPDDPGKLSRDWVVARLMRSALICLGELPSTQTKVIARAKPDGKIIATAVQVEGFSHDPAGANAALAQLMKELDRREGIIRPAEGAGAPAVTPERAAFIERMEQYAATYRLRQAERAERERAKAPNGNNGNAGPSDGNESRDGHD